MMTGRGGGHITLQGPAWANETYKNMKYASKISCIFFLNALLSNFSISLSIMMDVTMQNSWLRCLLLPILETFYVANSPQVKRCVHHNQVIQSLRRHCLCYHFQACLLCLQRSLTRDCRLIWMPEHLISVWCDYAVVGCGFYLLYTDSVQETTETLALLSQIPPYFPWLQNHPDRMYTVNMFNTATQHLLRWLVYLIYIYS